jgi:membrane associated rhomboid family serine protease
MLEDRSYMRSSSFDNRRSVTVVLLIINAVVFLVQLAVERFTEFPLTYYFGLSVRGLSHGYLWQLLTFQFMHGGWLHLLVNLWVIYMFGRELEQTLGRKPFLTLYLGSGIVGGLFQAAAGLLFPSYFGGATVGASAGAFGLVAAFATFYPERPLTLLLFFILPITVLAKYLLLFSVIVAVVGIVFPSGNVANAAHLGGIACGIFFARYGLHREFRWPQLRLRRTPSRRPLVKVPAAKTGYWGGAPEDLPSDDFLIKEVDPILDKISAQGIQSLTERERRILESARSRMGKR